MIHDSCPINLLDHHQMKVFVSIDHHQTKEVPNFNQLVLIEKIEDFLNYLFRISVVIEIFVETLGCEILIRKPIKVLEFVSLRSLKYAIQESLRFSLSSYMQSSIKHSF